MKKLFILLLFVANNLSSFAQDKPERLTVFKFYPFNLITSNLTFGMERFNEPLNRSTQFTFGVRYKNSELNNNYYLPNGMPVNDLNNYARWRGFNIGIERKIYVPALRKNSTDKNKYGVYFAPFIKADYNQNQFDNSFYNSIADSKDPSKYTYTKVAYTGTKTYIGVMPGVNLGFQFTLFQNLYADIYLGGALRILSKSEKSDQGVTSLVGYYSSNSAAIDNYVNKEGVIPNIGISVGVKW